MFGCWLFYLSRFGIPDDSELSGDRDAGEEGGSTLAASRQRVLHFRQAFEVQQLPPRHYQVPQRQQWCDQS